ncbi:hypothetical protein SAMN03159496_00443 [Rhizobium sp. NFR07]|uniref:hypothetical protein n=1 Tax=Rhizobium sp. NFR07 TaxID=1566262 RepID=UPI0008F0C914|nr:hypothetical protein [Rhizobium sp. NFR07]SFA80160.1 hypothetical protein SAMN03159496_00443 [Rhizobium sp. NFR07]
MIKLAAHRLTAIGALLFLFGLASKTMELAIPEWIACLSISAGLIAIIFVGGSRSLASVRRHGGAGTDRNGFRDVSYER